MLDQNRIRRFYINGFEETNAVRNWPRMWNKLFRIRTLEGTFIIKLNRFSFKALKRCARQWGRGFFLSVHK